MTTKNTWGIFAVMEHHIKPLDRSGEENLKIKIIVPTKATGTAGVRPPSRTSTMAPTTARAKHATPTARRLRYAGSKSALAEHILAAFGAMDHWIAGGTTARGSHQGDPR